MTEEIVLLVLLLAGSAAIASFIATWADRWPRGETVLIGRSYCDSCRSPVQPLYLLPIVGWFLARGRCHSCGAAISGYYPLVEGLGASVPFWLFYGPTVAPVWLSALLAATLLGLIAADVRHMLLPDRLVIALFAIALVHHYSTGSIAAALLGAVVGGGVFYAVRQGYYFWRGREGLGLGDVKLAAAAGALLGWQALPLLTALAGVMALAVVGATALLQRSKAPLHGGAPVPFGAYLAGAVWLMWFYPMVNAV